MHVSLKELYSYKMPSTFDEAELQKVQEPEEEALKECTFQPKTNKSTLKTEEEVFQRVGQHDVAERMRAKGIVQKQAVEAELKACTFSPKISVDHTKRISPQKKSTTKETTQRLWEDIAERQRRQEQLEKNHQTDTAPKRKVLSAKEAKDLVERMREDEEKRKKKYQQQLDLQNSPYKPEDVVDAVEKKLDRNDAKRLYTRLYEDERRKHVKEDLARQAKEEFRTDHPFKPHILENTEILVNQRLQRMKATPRPIQADVKEADKVGVHRGRSPSPRRGPGAPPARDKYALHSRARSAPNHAAGAAPRPRSPSRSRSPHRRNSGGSPGKRGGSPGKRGGSPRRGNSPRRGSPKRRAQSQPGRRVSRKEQRPPSPRVWQKETVASTGHKQPKFLIEPHVPRAADPSPRKPQTRSLSQGSRAPPRTLQGSYPGPNTGLKPLHEDHEAYHSYFSNRPPAVVALSATRRPRVLSLEDPPLKQLLTAGEAAREFDSSSVPPPRSKRSLSLTRGGSPGTSTTARSFTNPQEQLMYTTFEQRIENELQRRLEARGIAETAIRHY
eukprot:EG_transcript_3030